MSTDNTVTVLGAALQPGGNSPASDGRRCPCRWQLELLLSELPDHVERRYTAIPVNGSTLYVSVDRGIANFMLHTKQYENGYGGAKFDLTLVDGSDVHIKGPWSSSTATVNALKQFPLLVPAAATVSPTDWKRGYTLFALSGVTLDVVRQAMKFLPGWQFNEHNVYSGDTAAARRNCDLSDEQMAVVEHSSVDRGELFTYTRGLPVCESCNGRGSTVVHEGTPKAFRTARGEYVLLCEACNKSMSMWTGVQPSVVPGTRYRSNLITAA